MGTSAASGSSRTRSGPTVSGLSRARTGARSGSKIPTPTSCLRRALFILVRGRAASSPCSTRQGISSSRSRTVRENTPSSGWDSMSGTRHSISMLRYWHVRSKQSAMNVMD
ncbi:hypothetical protein U1Q18_037314 [Sarracenia purpurea var. burkii]